MQRMNIQVTKRELETLKHIVQGKTDIQIAGEMGITVHTVNAHRKSLLKKLRVNNVASLVRVAILDGYVRKFN